MGSHGCHVSRQGPSLRLRSAGSASTTLLPGPVADAWSDPWLLVASGTLRRHRHPAGAALTRSLRTWGSLRALPPRHSYCMVRKASRLESLGPPGLLHLWDSCQSIEPRWPLTHCAGGPLLPRARSLGARSQSSGRRPLAPLGAVPKRMCQLAKRPLWVQEGSPGRNPYYLAHSGGCNAIALFQLET
jgi:hypothetical protein